MKRRVVLAAALASLLAGCALNQSRPVEYPARISGKHLTTPEGMSLYIYNNDATNAGASECDDYCERKWPPLRVKSGAEDVGGYTVIVRRDGTLQWAYKGKPLYTFSQDEKPGDQKGDGLEYAWRPAQP